MEENKSRKWLYDTLTAKGYNVGKDYAEFDGLMSSNQESRKWAFEEARNLGYNVGKDFDEFESLINPVQTQLAPTDGELQQQGEQQQQTEKEYVEGFGEGFKQGWQGLVSGSKYLVGEVANAFSGSSEDDKNALGRWDELQKKGVDIAEATKTKNLGDDAIVSENGTLRALSQQEKLDYETIQKAIQEAGGDMDKARKLMEQRAKETTWGDSLKQEAAEEMNQMKPTKGLGAWVGNLAPQMLPSAAALALSYFTKNPKWAKMVGNIGMAGMTASTAGSTMKEARDAGASDMQVWGAGVADGTIEYLTEKLPFDKMTNRIFGNTKKKLSREIAEGLADNPQTREEMERLLGEAANSAGLNWKQVGKSVLAQTTAEGLSEAAAGTLQTATQMIYQEPENYPTLYDYVTNAWEGAKAGMFMGAVLGAPVPLAQKVQNDKRRKQQGEVYVAGYINDNGETEVVEVVGSSKDGNLVVFGQSGYKEISPEDVTYAHTFSYQEFKTGELEQEFDNGYNLETPQEMTDAKNMYDMQRQRVADALGEEVLADIDRDPEAAIGKLGEDERTNRTVIEYLNAKMVYDGMNTRVADDADARIAESDALVDSHTHKKTGMVQGATMKDEDRKVYIVNGNVVPLQDGTGIDLEASDNSIIIRDAESGELEQVSPEVLLNVDAEIDPTAEKQAAREAIEAEVRANAERMQNGVVGFAPGDVYTVLGEDGNIHQVEIVQDNGDNTVAANVDGEPVDAMAKEQIQNEVDAYNKQRVVLVADSAQGAEAAENAADAKPNYELNAHVTLQTPEGVVTGNINQAENDDNLIEVQVNKPFGGKMTVDMYTREELDNMVVEVADENGNVIWSKPAESAEAAANVQGAENTNTSPEDGAENVNTVPSAPIVRGKQGQIDVVESIKAGTSPQQMADAYMQEYGDEDGLPLSTAQENLAQVQEERQKTKDVNLKNGPLRKQEKFWSEVVDLLTPKEETVAEEGRQETVGTPVALQYLLEGGKGSIENAGYFFYAIQAAFPHIGAQLQEIRNSMPAEMLGMAPDAFVASNPSQLQEVRGLVEATYGEAGTRILDQMLANSTGFYPREGKALDLEIENLKPVEGNEQVQEVTEKDSLLKKVKDWLSPENISWAEGKSLSESIEMFGNEVEPIAIIPPVLKKYFPELSNLYLYSGKAYLIDHAANHHPELSVEEYENIQKTLDEYDDIKDLSSNGVKKLAFIKMMEKGYAVVTELSEKDGKIMLHKTFFYKDVNGKRVPYKNKPSLFDKTSVDGSTTISPAEKTTAGRHRNISALDVSADKGTDKSVTQEGTQEEISEKAQNATQSEQNELEKAEKKRIDALVPAIEDVADDMQTADEFVAGLFGNGIRITPESFRKETGLGWEEQRRLVGIIAGKEKGGLTVEQAAETIVENYRAELAERGFSGDSMEMRDMVIDILNSGNPRAYAKQAAARRAEQALHREMEAFDRYTQEAFHMSAEEYIMYEESMLPKYIEQYKDFDEQEYYSNFADEQSTQNEHDTTRESAETGGSREILSDEQSSATPGEGDTGEGQQGGTLQGDVQGNAQEGLARAEEEVNTNPTEAQKEAGNYKKGHVKIGTFNVTIEQPKGSVRSGVDADGKKWETEMQNTYGYIRGTEGVDGDHIDVFLSDDFDGWDGHKVFVVDQRNADGSFDEHKVMLGFNDINDAEAAYMSNYEEGWQGLGAITGVSVEEFEKWVSSSHRKTKPFAEYKNVKVTEGQNQTRFSTSIFDNAERIAREEQRRAPLRKRAREWERILGVKVHLIERLEDVKNPDAIREIQASEKRGKKNVPGWFEGSTGEVFVYLPHVENEKEVDKTCVHEIVSHKGLKELLGQEKFDELCRKVWGIMSSAAREKYSNYPNVHNELQAADEYMAHLSEKVELTARERSVWQKIMDFFADLLGRKADNRSKAASIVGKETLSRKDIAELVRLSYAEYLQRNGRESEKSAEGNVRLRFSKTPQEFDAIQKEAVEKKGIVMPGLNEAIVDVLSIDKHDFNGNLKQAREEAKQLAIENYQGKEFSLPDEGGSYTIGKKAINKYVDKTSIEKSDNAMIHLSALKELPNIISSSVTGEIHADYNKGENDKRNADNGIKDKGLLVHRMYGAIKLDGKTYRVKTTMNEYRDPSAANNPHSYEVTEIELIESSSTPSSKDDSKLVNVSNNSITGAKLLKGVEKSYDKGKKILDESEKISFRVLPNERLRKLDEGETCNVERVFTQQKMFNFSSGEKIESYEDVAYIFRSLEDDAVENAFVALVKNGKPTIVHLGMGTATQTTVDQQAVIVAIERINPDAVYFVHNHPSGNLKASRQDVLLLDSMKKAYGDVVKDGIIINLRSGKYAVFNEEGIKVEEASPNTPEKEIPAKTYSFSKRVFDKDFDVEELMPVTGADAVDAYAREHGLVAALTSSQRLGNRDKLSLLVLNPGNRIVGNVFLNHTEVLPSNGGAIGKEIAYYVSAMGGHAGILYGRFDIKKTKHLGDAVIVASAGSVRMLDAISMTEFGGYVSALDECVMEETPSYGKGETRFRVTDDIEEVNARFNEELEKLNEENADSIILSLGRPSDILISAGVEDKPMKLYGNKVIKKMKKHGFSISELRNLPEAVADPIAVFDNIGRKGNRSVLTELVTANGNFLVTLDLGKGEEIDFNIVSSVFGKGEDNIVDWFERGLSTYINKEKALNYLHHSALHAVALSSSRLDSAAKVIKDFQNPSVGGGIRFRSVDKLRDRYDKMVRLPNKIGSVKWYENLPYRLREAYQDSMLSLKVLQDVILEETGNTMTSGENAYMAENQMSSKNKAEAEMYERDFFKPMMEEVKNLLAAGATYDEVQKYLFAKHGLERNMVMYQKNKQEAIDKWIEERTEQLVNGGMTEADARTQAQQDIALYPSMSDSELDKQYRRDYSGLTALTEKDNVSDAEAEATKMVSDFEGHFDTAGLWGKINAATKEILRKSYDSGMMDKATYNKILGMYHYYIPLRGWNADVAEKEYEYLSDRGMNLSPVLVKTEGRTSLADDPIATIGFMAEGAIVQGNRNLMKQRFMNFVLNNPTSLVSVSKQWYVEQADGTWMPDNPQIPADATGDQVAAIVEQHEQDMLSLGKKAKTKRAGLKLDLHATKQEGQEHMVRVKRGGKEYCLYINGSPRAAQALNGMTNPDASNSDLYKAASAVKNFMARMFTSQNPAFVVSNLSRDLIWAGTAVAVRENKDYAARYTKNVGKAFKNATLPRLLHKYQNGTLDMNVEEERLFMEFIKHGGETGFTQITSVEDYKKDIKRFVKEVQKGKFIGKKVWDGFFDTVEFLNRSAEDTTRFMVYMTSRQMGRDVATSVSDAKEITVNFNKKGSGGLGASVMNFCYIFFNAAIQSLSGFGKMMAEHPKRTLAGLTAYASAGVIVPAMSIALQALTGDDDDESYWDLPEWIRRNNLVLYVPFTDSGFITIPLPHELRPFYAMGEIALSAMCGREDVEDGLRKVAMNFAEMLPLDFTGNGGNPAVNLTPTIAQPVAQIIANKDYTGKPVYKDYEWNKRDPEWTKAYKGTSPWIVEGTKWLNRLSGGDDVKSGRIDWNPDLIEHVLESYTGGAGKTFNRTMKTFQMMWDEDMRQWRNVPVISSFYQSGDERIQGSDVNNRYYEAKDEFEDTKHLLSGYKEKKKEHKPGTADYVEYARKLDELMNSDEYKRYKVFKGRQKAIKKVSDKLKETDDRNRIDSLNTRLMQLKEEMLEELEKADDSPKP